MLALVRKVREAGAAGRERSSSKRRKTIEKAGQQHITQYTRHSDVRRKALDSDDEDDKQAGGVDGNPTILATIMSKLEIMDNNITANKQEFRQTDQKLERILCESFEIRKENMTIKKSIDKFSEHLEDVTKEVEILKKRLGEERELRNNLEQYTRRDNIKIVNLPGDTVKETAEETEKLVLIFLHRQMGLTSVTNEHISIAHRVGPCRQSQNRPVIIKLIARKTKTLIMKNKKLFKGKRPLVYVNEDLTKLNAQRLAEVKKHVGVLSAWTMEGNLYCKLLNLEVIKVENGDLDLIDRVLIHTPLPCQASGSAGLRRQGQGQGSGGRGQLMGLNATTNRAAGRGRGRGGCTPPGHIRVGQQGWNSPPQMAAGDGRHSGPTRPLGTTGSDAARWRDHQLAARKENGNQSKMPTLHHGHKEERSAVLGRQVAPLSANRPTSDHPHSSAVEEVGETALASPGEQRAARSESDVLTAESADGCGLGAATVDTSTTGAAVKNA
ncbi:hypothetical protein ACOMHN_007953 [Nucella lapillus]